MKTGNQNPRTSGRGAVKRRVTAPLTVKLDKPWSVAYKKKQARTSGKAMHLETFPGLFEACGKQVRRSGLLFQQGLLMPDQLQKESVMKALKLISMPIAAAVCMALSASPMGAGAAESGSDQAFNQMIGTMARRDTGSGWFDYYVEELNQQIALQQDTQPYGAAGPEGPLDGFSGYVGGFRMPDTGSKWFNHYLEALNLEIKQRQQSMPPEL
jgi:hypothetical protein